MNNTQAVGRGAALVVAIVALCGAQAEELKPYQFREPEKFWTGKKVIQKRGIVIEDPDYIVRNRYWVLDRSVTGRVVDVEAASGEKVFLSVRFDVVGAGWEEVGSPIRNRRVTNTRRTVRIRSDSYGEVAASEVDEVSFSYDIEGEQVEASRCGVIIAREGAVTVVRFPAMLISLVPLRKGDAVVRSDDWHDGFADGGDSPAGPHKSSMGDCVGVVTGERDKDGFVGVTWQKTGRKKSHRFDHRGYYDVQQAN